jgi:lipid kinase YegS
MRIGMIIRPREGATGLEGVREAVEVLRSDGHEVWPRLTFEAGDGLRLARAAAARGADLVLAVGGDGTVNEVVNGLMRVRGWAGGLGIVATGTANDFAAGLDIPTDPETALEVAVGGVAREVDVARVNDRHFVNVSTGGFGAAATEETGSDAKRLLGPLAYLVTGVKKFAELEASWTRFRTPSGVAYEGESLLFAVGNGKQTGGGTLLTPRADLGDGELDVVVVRAMARMEFLALLPDLRAGTHLEHPDVLYVRTPRLVVESEVPLSVNADGEPMRGSRFEYRVVPRRLRVMVPG